MATFFMETAKTLCSDATTYYRDFIDVFTSRKRPSSTTPLQLVLATVYPETIQKQVVGPLDEAAIEGKLS